MLICKYACCLTKSKDERERIFYSGWLVKLKLRFQHNSFLSFFLFSSAFSLDNLLSCRSISSFAFPHDTTDDDDDEKVTCTVLCTR